MIHQPPLVEDVAAWGWTAQDAARVLREIEDHRGPEPGRGRGGPVRNGTAPNPNALCSAFVDAAVEAGFPRFVDAGAPGARGAGLYDLSIDDEGRRADAARSYLRPLVGRLNLHVRPDTSVEGLVLHNRRVRALHVTTAGVPEELPVNGEVVLCAGAVDSPVLLLRSGIGPVEHLYDCGIAPVVPLPGVGRNLQDHPALPVVWSCAEPVAPPNRQFFESMLFLDHEPRAGGRNLIVAFGHLPFLPPAVAPPPHGATALIGLLDPHSRGTVTLDPAEPQAAPLLDPGYLRDPRDLAPLVAAVELVRDVVSRGPLRPFGLSELMPGTAVRDRASIEEFVRAALGSFFHPVGTCAMGSGSGGVVDTVVDNEFRVHGTTNLRVADAAVLPRAPAAATSVSAQMVGWRAAEILLGGVAERQPGMPSLRPCRSE
ncbi:GMC family oxidoreductase [Pseudonocardia asaccharolytica]|nr:GMC oxidoreductase [Pseudonocardia asaccharolytica]